MESKVVTAVGVITISHHGAGAEARLSKAMSNAVEQCLAEGLSLDESNAAVIRARMAEAHARELAEIEAGR